MASSAYPIMKKARKQVADDGKKTQSVISMDTYNIWYDRHLSYERVHRTAATTRCSISKDAGRTKGDENPAAFICLYFARGCCQWGHECVYLHRLPDQEFENRLGLIHDIFGRDRHSTDRDDMGGVGTFNRDNRTLYIGGIRISKGIEDILKQHFSEWGEVEYVRVLVTRNCGFVRYTLRSSAEFAKEAMSDQSLNHKEMLNVRWATEDPNPAVKKRIREQNEDKFQEAYERIMPEAAEFQRWQESGGLYGEDGNPYIPPNPNAKSPGPLQRPTSADENQVTDPEERRRIHEAWQQYYDYQIALSIQQECGEFASHGGAYTGDAKEAETAPVIATTNTLTPNAESVVNEADCSYKEWTPEAYAAYYQQYYEYYQYSGSQYATDNYQQSNTDAYNTQSLAAYYASQQGYYPQTNSMAPLQVYPLELVSGKAEAICGENIGGAYGSSAVSATSAELNGQAEVREDNTTVSSIPVQSEEQACGPSITTEPHQIDSQNTNHTKKEGANSQETESNDSEVTLTDDEAEN